MSDIERLRALAEVAMARRSEATSRPLIPLVWDAAVAEQRLEQAVRAGTVIALLDVAEAAREFGDPLKFATDADGSCWFCDGPTDPAEEHDEDPDCPVTGLRFFLAALTRLDGAS